MFKKFLNKYRSEVRVLLRLSIFGLVSTAVVFNNKYKLQDYIINLFLGIGSYSIFLIYTDNKLTYRAKTLAVAISLVSILTLFVLVILMGARHTI